MIKFIYCNYNAISQQERAKEILFNNANKNDFKFMFEFNNTKYYKRITKHTKKAAK